MEKVSLPVVLLSLVLLLAETASAGHSCVTDTCHSRIGKEKYVHGPVAVGECVVCHEKLGEHKFKKIVNTKALCDRCHDSKTGISNSHKSVAKDYRECAKCHDAHQSSRPQMLLVKSS